MSPQQRPEILTRLKQQLETRTRREYAVARRSAAVLVPLVRGTSGLDVLFTLRTDDVPTHKGQVAFPGGGVEDDCLLYTSPSPRDGLLSRMPSSA